jgi:hypothetical protein
MMQGSIVDERGVLGSVSSDLRSTASFRKYMRSTRIDSTLGVKSFESSSESLVSPALCQNPIFVLMMKTNLDARGNNKPNNKIQIQALVEIMFRAAWSIMSTTEFPYCKRKSDKFILRRRLAAETHNVSTLTMNARYMADVRM